MKFATKPIWRYAPHLRHVATLPWEIKNPFTRLLWPPWNLCHSHDKHFCQISL